MTKVDDIAVNLAILRFGYCWTQVSGILLKAF